MLVYCVCCIDIIFAYYAVLLALDWKPSGGQLDLRAAEPEAKRNSVAWSRGGAASCYLMSRRLQWHTEELEDALASINQYMEDTQRRNDEGQIPLGLVPLSSRQMHSLYRCSDSEPPGQVEEDAQVTWCWRLP